MDDYIKSLLKDFFEEAFDMLDRLEQNILILDKDRNNTDAIQEIFRAVHTLKGSAGAVELFDTQKYAHRFEDLLDLIRNNQIKVDDKTIDILLKGIDILKELINGASEEKEYSGNIEEEIKNLENFKNLKLSGAISESLNTKSEKDSISVSVGGKYDNLNFDNDISVIIKINKNGKISADFLPSSQVAEAYLKENLPILKQRFDDNNIDYEELNHRKQEQQDDRNNRKKGRKDE